MKLCNLAIANRLADCLQKEGIILPQMIIDKLGNEIWELQEETTQSRKSKGYCASCDAMVAEKYFPQHESTQHDIVDYQTMARKKN